jgi:pyrimidine-nucleoside phosphorylase
MSKKIAAGAQAIVLDVKVGLGAFMQTEAEARTLASLMVEIAKLAGRKAVALLSDMNQPLGQAVGNALEVKEAIETLHGGGPADFREHCLEVASQLLVLGGVATHKSTARQLAVEAINDGRGLSRFRELVSAQGGDVSYVDDSQKLPQAEFIESVPAPRTGYLSQIHARVIGETVVELGGGRAKKGDPIDHAVGVVVHHKVGDFVETGAPLFNIHANNPDLLEIARTRILEAHQWSDTAVKPLPLFYGTVK